MENGPNEVGKQKSALWCDFYSFRDDFYGFRDEFAHPDLGILENPRNPTKSMPILKIPKNFRRFPKNPTCSTLSRDISELRRSWKENPVSTIAYSISSFT